MFSWYLIFLKRSLVFPILLVSSLSLHWLLKKAFLSLLAILWNSAFKWEYLSFSPLPFSSVQSFSRVLLFATPWMATHQASLSITNSRSLPKLMSIESVMPSNHLILCYPLLLLPPIFSRNRVFSIESALCIRWPKYWSFSFISPFNEHPGLICFRMDWFRSYLNCLVVSPSFFSLSLNLAIRNLWSEPQSTPSLVLLTV